MTLLLDTHFAFWWQTGDPRVTAEVRRVVEAADEVFVSRVSLWELTIKAGLGRPPAGSVEALSAAEIALIATWVQEGMEP